MSEELEKIVENEYQTARYIHHRASLHTSRATILQSIKAVFPLIDHINEKFLGSFAVNTMRREMAEAMMYLGKEESIESLKKASFPIS